MTAQGEAVAHWRLPGTLWKGSLCAWSNDVRFSAYPPRSWEAGQIAGKTGYGLVSGSQDAPGSVHHHVHAVSVMTETANRFLAALSSKQRAKATFQFSDDERMNWQFIPKERKGLALGEMSPYQKHLASALLAAGLSQTGYIKAVTIMSLEDVLKVLENDNGEHRDPEKCYFTVFGTPSDTGTWGS